MPETNDTDQDAYIKQLLTQIEDLKQSNQDLEHFAYVASHDLQSPLNAVQGFLKLIRKDLPPEQLNPEVQMYFQQVFDGVDRLQQLIEDLLEYSRAGRMVERQLVKTVPMLEIVKYNLGQEIQARYVTIETSNLPDGFMGHRMGITQLFQNLLSNAILFGPPASHTIHIHYEPLPEFHQFSIKDHGIGIAQKDQQRIFELFTRLVPRQQGDKGTGIGLALCKRIIESHGGRIWVESEKGQGTTFYFTIRKTEEE